MHHVAERVHETGREVAGERRARERHEAQRRRVVAGAHLGRQLHDAQQHDRDRDEDLGPVAGDQCERAFRVEVPLQHHGVADQQARRRVGEAPRVEARRGDDHVLVRAVREAFEQRDRGAGVGRARHERTFGRSRRPRRKDDRAAGARGPLEARTVGVPVGEVAERAAVVGRGRVVGPGPQAVLDARRAGERREFVVVDEEHRALAVHDVGDLRGGEPGVQVDGVDAQLGECAGDFEEVAMVAAQDGDGVAGADPGLDEAAADRVGAGVEVGEAQRPSFVDERGAVAVPGGAHGEQCGDPGPPLADRFRHSQEAGRTFGAQHPRPQHRPGRVGRVGDLLGGAHGPMLRADRVL